MAKRLLLWLYSFQNLNYCFLLWIYLPAVIPRSMKWNVENVCGGLLYVFYMVFYVAPIFRFRLAPLLLEFLILELGCLINGHSMATRHISLVNIIDNSLYSEKNNKHPTPPSLRWMQPFMSASSIIVKVTRTYWRIRHHVILFRNKIH